MVSWPPAMWCATTPTGHFSAAVVFFQSASLSRSITAVASWAFVSNCFAKASALAPMVSSLLSGCSTVPDDTARPRHAEGARPVVVNDMIEPRGATLDYLGGNVSPGVGRCTLPGMEQARPAGRKAQDGAESAFGPLLRQWRAR